MLHREHGAMGLVVSSTLARDATRDGE